MLRILSPEEVGKLMQGKNAEWFRFGCRDSDWTSVYIKFNDLVGKHTQIIDWVAKEIPTDVYGAIYDSDVFPSTEELAEKLAVIDAWVKAGEDTDSSNIFRKKKTKNLRENERAEQERQARLPIKQSVGYIFCFCTAEDALKFKMVWA